MLLLVGPGWRVETVSANAGMLGLGEPEDWLGRPIVDVLGEDAVHEVRNRMTWLNSDRAMAQDYGLRLGPGDAAYDLQVRMIGDHFLIEAEPVAEKRLPDPIGMARSMLDRIGGGDFLEIATSGLRQLRALTGYNRLTLCRRDGIPMASSAAGTVPTLDEGPLPDSRDFPRVIADFAAAGAPLLGHAVEETARQSTFAAPDAEETERLTGLGIAAALSLPLRIDGENVGTIHAHHRSPKRCAAERRAVAGLLADRIAGRMARHGWQP